MRILILILITLLFTFQYSFWFGKNGYMAYLSVEKDIEKHKNENEQLSQRNQLIMAEINDLKNGIKAIEERARLEHEMIKPNEVFYRLVKSDEYK